MSRPPARPMQSMGPSKWAKSFPQPPKARQWAAIRRGGGGGPGRRAAWKKAAVVLMLPVLFVLMLPGLIFGGLASSGTPGQPILNNSAAVTGHMNEIAAAIDEILGEGVTDAEARVAQNFAATDGDRYEVVQPFTVSSNTNSFIGQYCAAREQDWAAISLEDMKRLLRNGKSQLYSFTRTSETRVVEADDLDTGDVVETKEEKWYIYTVVYNGEAYFAGQVFHLTDDQKALADNCTQNLSLFLGDGMFQQYGGSTITNLGNARFTDSVTEVVYFSQRDQRYANQPYGTDNISGYGCGPTSMSIVVSSLTGDIVDPVRMAKWAYKNGGWCKGQGSYHSLIPNAARAWGLPVEGCTASEPQRILTRSATGNWW